MILIVKLVKTVLVMNKITKYKFVLVYDDFDSSIVVCDLENKPLLFNSIDEAIKFRKQNDLSLVHKDHHYRLTENLGAPSTVAYFVSKPNITNSVIMEDMCDIQVYETYTRGVNGKFIKTSKF